MKAKSNEEQKRRKKLKYSFTTAEFCRVMIIFSGCCTSVELVCFVLFSALALADVSGVKIFLEEVFAPLRRALMQFLWGAEYVSNAPHSREIN